MQNYYFPHREFTYIRTPEFVQERFGKSKVWDPQISIRAASPGEAILKFHRYVQIGISEGAYEW